MSYRTFDGYFSPLSDGYNHIQAAAGVRVVVSMPDNDYDALPSQYTANIIEVTGSLTATRNFLLPDIDGWQWTVFNDTTGGEDITFVVFGQTGVTIANGKRAIVYCNGIDIVRVTPDT